jgi:glycylpeptide N-tetradecanoyltransferase
VEDDDASFRFNYSADFLKWALKPPGWEKDWHVGVRVVPKKAANDEAKTKGRLVAFISAVPVRLRVRERSVLHLIRISFLGLHNYSASSPLPKSISSAYIRSYGQSVSHRF